MTKLYYITCDEEKYTYYRKLTLDQEIYNFPQELEASIFWIDTLQEDPSFPVLHYVVSGLIEYNKVNNTSNLVLTLNDNNWDFKKFLVYFLFKFYANLASRLLFTENEQN